VIKVCLAHDYLTQRGGAERVALELTRVFPNSALYTALYNPLGTYEEFAHVDIRCSDLQRIGILRKDPRLALPLLSCAWDKTEAPDVDAVVVSSSGWAHGIRTRPRTAKVVYCHNPPRWLYQTAEYSKSFPERAILSTLRPRLTKWDKRAAQGADLYIANSSTVAARIEAAYGFRPPVIHPPVMLDSKGPQTEVAGLEPGFFLTVARGRSYKNVDVVTEAIKLIPGAQLAIVGARSEQPRTGGDRTVHSLGVVSDSQLRWLYAHARALVTVSFEDFGLTPIEANLFGTPVLALRAGGHLDSVVEGESGWWIESPTTAAVRSAVETMPVFNPATIRNHAEKFRPHIFANRLNDIVGSVVDSR
jgi:glycosyltransferase involved in cell wall biosynthesis